MVHDDAYAFCVATHVAAPCGLLRVQFVVVVVVMLVVLVLVVVVVLVVLVLVLVVGRRLCACVCCFPCGRFLWSLNPVCVCGGVGVAVFAASPALILLACSS